MIRIDCLLDARWLFLGRLLLIAATLTTLLSAPGFSQVPKPGDWYEETSDVGFKVRVPNGWEFIPASPDEGNAIGTYEPKVPKYISVGGEEVLFVHCWLLVFDRRESTQARLKKKKVSPDLASWIERESRSIGTDYSEQQAKETKVGKIECVEYMFEGNGTVKVGSGRGDERVYVYAMLYKLAPDLEFALAFNAPADKRKWKKWRSPLQKMAKSFKRLEVEERMTGEATGPGAGSLRAQKRARLEAELARTPGWELYESPNYFIVSNNKDEDFLEELMDRLEAIRVVYEADYPIDKALEAHKAKAKRESEKENGKDSKKGSAKDEQRTTATRADPMEASRTSVVRVCSNDDEYRSYGGPPNSAGYWAAMHEELVIYDDKAVGGRGDTWITLNHEAFHQYIFYFYGNISPHSWYNEGTGDYYSGYQLDGRNKFQLSENSWRVRIAEQNIRAGRICPLKEFVRWTQAQYYGQNDYKLDGGDNYAQGWSYIYFLRTGKKNKAKGWDDSWDTILDTYLDTLAATGDLDKAVDQAYAGVDWTALEQAWKDYYQ